MAESTIEWTHWTFNPWLGCAKVHAGCTNCYAEKHQAVAMRKGGRVQWGEVWAGGQRVVTSDSTWAQPLAWARAAARAGERRRVFCASLADVLEVPSWAGDGARPEVKDSVAGARGTLAAARARLWELIRTTAVVCRHCGAGRHQRVSFTRKQLGCEVRGHDYCAGLDWLLLTKRPENWTLVPEDVRPLVWLGTSVSDQKTAAEWLPRLHQAKGFRYRYLSLEPLVGPVDALWRWLWQPCSRCEGRGSLPVDGGGRACPACFHHQCQERAIDWVIVGGESGKGARRCRVSWVRSVVEQCREAGVPCFVKQMGGNAGWSASLDGSSWIPWDLADAKGGNPEEWPEDLRVRELPESAHV